ncbi:hypothetical protein [Trinickia dinghuensis]|uniref:hypothetical protein n=1 Tax=Trinickia dinghuensis TaxID=2291023 RepID=UPI0015F13B4C|nr:hypothetical protein [Trinickia dinghuensis]
MPPVRNEASAADNGGKRVSRAASIERTLCTAVGSAAPKQQDEQVKQVEQG